MTDETREREVPDGFRLAWVEEDDNWQAVFPATSRPCRYNVGHGKPCGEPSVLALRRGTQRPQWWHYCANHLYGRRIHEGRVEHQILVPVQEGTDKP